jgi:hypothetical protein
VSVVRAGILSPAGSRIARFPVALSGQFSGTGTLARRMLATHAGTGGVTGTIVRSPARVVGGALHLAGVLVRSRDAPIARLDQDHPASFREESVSGAIAGTDSRNRFHDTAIGRFIADRVVGRFRP